jgi:glycosyltransferase involved in cell wall biosynthesis
MNPKLAIVLSHPVQYYSPLFVALAKEVDLKVFYAFQPNAQQQGKEGFGKAFEWDVDLLSGYDYEFVENIANEESSSHYLGCDTPKLGERLKAFGATHVISFGWYLKMHRQALSYCKKNKIPIAVRGDSILEAKLPLWKKVLKKIYYPFFLKQYDAFLSVGKRNRAYLKHYGVPEERIIFSPHAVDQSFWQTERKKNGEDDFTFIWVGKFMELKRPLDVIRAFKKLHHQHPNVKLKMIGSGDLFDSCQKETGEERKIELLGFKNQGELRELYAEADCLILSSDSETWGVVVNEAFAAGIPAIVSDACGCAADLINEDTGRVYSYGAIDQLKDAMSQMLKATNNKERIQKAIQKKNELYSIDRNVIAFKEFLNKY